MGENGQRNGRHVALLRGINVGGRNPLAMRDLKVVLEELGCSEIQTYIQSGNAVFRAANLIAKELPEALTERIARRFEMQIPVVMRDFEQMTAVSQSNPFVGHKTQNQNLHVAFLATFPSESQLSDLDPHRSPGDSYVVLGKEIYLHCPNGLARTKLTNRYFDTTLETTATIRNWKTVLKLTEMLRSFI